MSEKPIDDEDAPDIIKYEDVLWVSPAGSEIFDIGREGQTVAREHDLEHEETPWVIDDVERVENAGEDRLTVFPEGEYFTCIVEPTDSDDRFASGIYCWCPEIHDDNGDE